MDCFNSTGKFLPTFNMRRHKQLNTGFSVLMEQMFQTAQVDSKFFCQQLFLFPGFTLSSGPLVSSVVLCLSQSVELALDQTFWQSESEVIRIGCVALSASNIAPPELHFTPCFFNQPSPLGVQAHPCRQVKEDPTNHLSQKLNFSSIGVLSASF